jgi:hypothetical protein
MGTLNGEVCSWLSGGFHLLGMDPSSSHISESVSGFTSNSPRARSTHLDQHHTQYIHLCFYEDETDHKILCRKKKLHFELRKQMELFFSDFF